MTLSSESTTYRVGQNRLYTPYMIVCLVIFLPKYLIYIVYIWFWPTLNTLAFKIPSERHGNLFIRYEQEFWAPTTYTVHFRLI